MPSRVPSARAVIRRVAGKPARVVASGFALAIAVGTILLMLPVASEEGTATGWVAALFTATSSICVTGLIVVDTPGHWSMFGELVILGLIQVGGFGIMTLASLLGLLVTRRLGLRMQRSAATETKTFGIGAVRRVVLGVLTISLVVEALTALALTARLVAGYGEPLGRASYLGVFHAVSAFNNAGFALYSDSLVGFATDPWICLPIVVAFMLGGLGFPVLFELGRHARRQQHRWSLHLRITLGAYAALVVVGVVAVIGIEWNNPATLGQYEAPGRLLAGFFQGVTPRTAGFNTVDVGAMQPASLLVTDVLMFIGGGSAGTAGGIKVTTFALLGFVMLAEARGEPHVHVLGRKLPREVHRQALTVVLAGVGLVLVATLALLLLSSFKLDAVLFEATSAFGTVGLSTGITGELSRPGQLILVVLMFVGRIGPITVASALALRERGKRYDLPEERPIVG
ncbi:potassium uptake protein, TrkH family [Actinopolyspora mzabensis]|uniref:Potassium uptake protein, TrkH family n=1 Tax=Actinopolyspora mzabensis TaxID=995066 RepID=A0A1G8Y2L5_ACTMZ|nr:potassium transporter TrkG [Actinopolyspora mzabensis]SDJ96355.1 potassium uptake protein, TrkH family [Actinopolyspora mzabensis]